MFIVFVFAIALMVTDNVPTLPNVRGYFEPLVHNIERLSNVPFKFSNWLREVVISHNSLLLENKQLKEEQLALKAELQTYNSLIIENNRLRSLLGSTANKKFKLIAANITFIDPDPFMHQFVLDKGSKHGIHVGQVIVDEHGLMGSIISVTDYTSRTLLISDASQAVPVENVRNGIRAIASGNGMISQLELKHIPNTTDIIVGDEFVTSGIGGRYPYGYPVGIVSKVDHDASRPFAIVSLKPKAELERGRQVLLIQGSNNE